MGFCGNQVTSDDLTTSNRRLNFPNSTHYQLCFMAKEENFVFFYRNETGQERNKRDEKNKRRHMK